MDRRGERPGPVMVWAWMIFSTVMALGLLSIPAIIILSLLGFIH